MKRDVILNSITSVWIAALGFLFAPAYVHYLGVEAYGLIGLLAALQASFGLFDFGMSQVLARELARFIGGDQTTQAVRDLVRSVEIIALVIAVGVTLAIALPSPWIAQTWLKTRQVPVDGLADIIKVMGVLVALRILEGVYRSALVGLDRQFALNVVTLITMTSRAVGALAVAATTRSVQDFFIWQVVITAAGIAMTVIVVYATLPDRNLRGVFSLPELRRISTFAGGVTAVSVLSIVLSQADKLLLSNLLTLHDFGEYTLASTLAMAPVVFVPPIAQASQPKLSQAAALPGSERLSAIFHGTAQLVAVCVGAAAIVICLFSDQLLRLWLNDPGLALRLAPIVSVLAISGLMGCLTWVIYALQLAHGSTRLTLRANLIAVAILIPALFVIAPRYGALGAATLWLVINSGMLAGTALLVFRSYLVDQRLNWLCNDTAMPLLAAAGAALFVKLAAPSDGPFWLRAAVLIVASAAALIAATAAAPLTRDAALGMIKGLYRQATCALNGSR